MPTITLWMRKDGKVRHRVDFQAYCSRLGLQASHLRFVCDELLSPDDTPDQRGLEDDHILDVVEEDEEDEEDEDLDEMDGTQSRFPAGFQPMRMCRCPSGNCRQGWRCMFAHSASELHPPGQALMTASAALSRCLVWKSGHYSTSPSFWQSSGFPERLSSLRKTSASESCDTQPNCDTLLPIATAFLSSHSLLFGMLLFFGFFYLVVHQPCNAETDTCLQPYKPFHFEIIGTRADAKIHKTFACRHLSNNICTVVEEWTQGYFCLGYFSSSTHFGLVMRFGSESVAAVCSGFCARSWVSWRKLHRSPCEHWPFSFHWWHIPFPPSTPINPFRFLTTAPDSILPCLVKVS